MQLSSDGNLPQWSPVGDAIIFEAERDGTSGIWQVPAPTTVLVGQPIPFVAEMEVDRKKEFLQVFEEAWLAIKNGFYDPKLHEVDWEGVKKQYQPLAQGCEVQDELHDVIRRMLGELRSSHMGISDEEGRSQVTTGELGVTLHDAPRTKGMLITEVVKEGPADKAWLREGDLLLRIQGKELGPTVNIHEVLQDQVGKDIEIVVGEGGDPKKARTVKLKPTSPGFIRQLRYKSWIDGNQERTDALSKKRLGYVHLNAMDDGNLTRFQNALGDTFRDKEGLVIDVRNNGGGNIHRQLLDILGRKPYAFFDPRGGRRQLQEAPVWNKPVILLINHRSFSDAEIFAHGFRAVGLGKLVGVPTSGGVIGTGSVTLADGSVLRMPRVGWYSFDGKNLEGWGIEPDVRVDITPTDEAEGRDPQLDAAIRLLADELDAASKAEEPATSGEGPKEY